MTSLLLNSQKRTGSFLKSNQLTFNPVRTLQFKGNQLEVLSKGKGGRSSVSGLVATVFGATGFVGRHVVNRFGKIGSQVIIPYRGEETKPRHLKIMGDLGQIVPIPFDFQDHDNVVKVIGQSRVVVNLIGRFWPTKNFSLEEANYHTAYVVAQSARQAGVDRFIHVSALGASLKSDSAFLRAKAYGEEAVREFFPTATILRPAPIFGAEDRFLNRFGYFTTTPYYPMFEPEKGLVQPISAFDFATALMNALEDPFTAGKTYELAGPKVYTRDELREMALQVCRGSKTDRKTLHVTKLPFSSQLLKVYFKWASLTRDPSYTEDEWVYLNRDLVQTPGVLNISDLRVQPEPIEKHAVFLFRPYANTRLVRLAAEGLSPQ